MQANLFRPFPAGFTHEVFEGGRRHSHSPLKAVRKIEGEEPPTLAFDVIGQYNDFIEGEFVRTGPDSVQFGSQQPIALPSKPVKTAPLVLDETGYLAVQSEDDTLRLVGRDGIVGQWPFRLHEVHQSEEGTILKASDGALLTLGPWNSRANLEVHPELAPEIAFEEDWLTVGDAGVTRA